MRKTGLFRDLLGLKSPWKVVRAQIAPEGKVDVWLMHRRRAKFPCPECGAPLPVHDHVPERSWRHLDTGGLITQLHARVPRVACLLHGTHQVTVPWALPRSRCTIAFERWAIDVLKETDVLGATRLLNISWDEAWRLMERAVERGRQRKQRTVVPRLGVDEKAIAKGHKYITLVCDLDQGTVEYLSDDRKKESLNRYYESLSPEQLAGIEAVAMDMWDPYIASTHQYVANASAKIVFDRYHIMTNMNKAVDEVRKQEHRQLLASGDVSLKGTKYMWLYAAENLPEQHQEAFAILRRMHLKTGRAYAIKESLRDLWIYRRRGWAERHWQRWYSWATRCRLPAVRRVAKTLRKHLPNVLTYFAHRITNAVSEGLNSKIQTIKKTHTVFGTANILKQLSTSTAADLTFILTSKGNSIAVKLI